jgi:hypothetical protein
MRIRASLPAKEPYCILGLGINKDNAFARECAATIMLMFLF